MCGPQCVFHFWFTKKWINWHSGTTALGRECRSLSRQGFPCEQTLNSWFHLGAVEVQPRPLDFRKQSTRQSRGLCLHASPKPGRQRSEGVFGQDESIVLLQAAGTSGPCAGKFLQLLLVISSTCFFFATCFTSEMLRFCFLLFVLCRFGCNAGSVRGKFGQPGISSGFQTSHFAPFARNC